MQEIKDDEHYIHLLHDCEGDIKVYLVPKENHFPQGQCPKGI